MKKERGLLVAEKITETKDGLNMLHTKKEHFQYFKTNATNV